MQNVEEILTQAQDKISQATDLSSLDGLRVNYLGKKGELTLLLKNLANVSAEERPKVGQAVNQAKQAIALLINDKKQQMMHNQVMTLLSLREAVYGDERTMVYGNDSVRRR